MSNLYVPHRPLIYRPKRLTLPEMNLSEVRYMGIEDYQTFRKISGAEQIRKGVLTPASSGSMGGGVPAASSLDFTTITYWLNFEGSWSTPTYTIGASEYSYTAGGGVGTLVSAANVTTGSKVGTYCLVTTSSNDGMTFPIGSGFALDKGRIGFWFYSTTWVDQPAILIIADNDNSDNIMVKMYGTAGELRVIYKAGGDGWANELSTTAAIVNGTWNFIEVAYDTTLGATDYVDLYVNGVRKINKVIAMTPLAASTYTLTLLDTTEGVNMTGRIDNVMISNDPAKVFYTNGTSDLSVATAYVAP